jgi:hypothetical protein
MLFHGFIDESYNPRTFTLACLTATTSDWLWIELAWVQILRRKNKELRRYGRPTISRYHASDCSSLKGEFEGGSVEEQIEFVKELLGVYRRHMMSVTAYSVPIEDFKAVFPECAADPLPHLYAYLVKFLMVEIVAQIADATGGQIRKPIQIALFQDRCAYGSGMSAAYNSVLDDPDFRNKEWFRGFAVDVWEKCIPLQAADLIAYEAFKDVENQAAGRRRRKSLPSILESATFGGRSKVFTRETLQSLRATMERP